jgi:hypothetical protein
MTRRDLRFFFLTLLSLATLFGCQEDDATLPDVLPLPPKTTNASSPTSTSKTALSLDPEECEVLSVWMDPRDILKGGASTLNWKARMTGAARLRISKDGGVCERGIGEEIGFRNIFQDGQCGYYDQGTHEYRVFCVTDGSQRKEASLHVSEPDPPEDEPTPTPEDVPPPEFPT